MNTDRRENLETPALVAEMREIIAETRKTIAASQAILDRCTAAAQPVPAESSGEGGGGVDAGLLDGIVDGLIVAYEYAKIDNDPLTLVLIERAMMHVGRRIAAAVGPKEAGLACH